MMNKIATAHAVLVALIVLNSPLSVLADPAKQDDVVVKKNADGTVEASDAQPTPVQQPEVHYRLHNPVGTRRINGVTIRTNPDGSIETVDDSGPVAAHTRHRTTTTHAHKATKTTKKH
ncbi:MAG TPA: hypothetical protein V6C81_29485 [Planktothrix sp.]|jgi:hypothetical protein